MMSSDELRDHINALDISFDEAAMFLGVSKRTFSRWADGDEIPGPAQAALRAWVRLNERHFAWKPDSISVLERDEDQIERQRAHALRFSELLKRVELRGGPTHPWKVNFRHSTATFGTSEVTFHKLANGGFSLASYRRSDRHPDLNDDTPLVEDAAYCIATEYAKFGAQAAALKAVAEYARANSTLFALQGRVTLTPKQTTERQKRIEWLAARLDELAVNASEGFAIFVQYEDLQSELHSNGFYPPDLLVAAVARAFVSGAPEM